MVSMTTIYSFERQPYLTDLEAEIVDVREESGEWLAVLQDTILYPEGGGQPSDRGRLNDVAVSSVRKTDSGLQHVLEGPAEPGRGRLVLDWGRRYDHMQQHTAQHLLTRTALDRCGWSTRSFHVGPQVSDIELDCKPPTAVEIERLEDAVAEIVVQARPIRGYRVTVEEYEALDVRSRGLPSGHQGDIRLVEIENFDLNTCGGTHLASTSEVETVKVVGSEPLRGGCRLFWVAGKRVRDRLATHENKMVELRKLMDAGDETIVQVVGSRLEQLQQSRRARRWLEKRLAESMARHLTAEVDEMVDLHLEDHEVGLLRPLAEELSRHERLLVALLTADTEAGALFAVVTGEESVVELQSVGKAVAEALGGRGGGAGRIFQGKAGNLERRPDAVRAIQTSLP